MRSTRYLAAAALATLALPAFPAGAANPEVKVGSFYFRSDYVRVDPGEAVTWRFQEGADHTVTSRGDVPERFDSGVKEAGQTYEFTFTRPGRYVYTCRLHPFLGQRGVIQVGPDTTLPVLTAAKARRRGRRVNVAFRLSEDAKVKAVFKRGRKRVKTVRTKLLLDGKRSVRLKLAPGRYTVRLTGADRDRNVSKPVKATFRVPKPR